MKKVSAILFLLFIAATGLFADIAVSGGEGYKTLTKDNFTYKATMQVSDDYNYFFGIIKVESIKEPKYSYKVPIYAIKLDQALEGDVQWVLIETIEFKNNTTLSILNEHGISFELNINTFEIKCINTENNLFKFISNWTYECISGNVNELYEKNFKKIVTKNAKKKYTGTQSEVKKLTKLEDIVNVAEQALFEIYGKDNIRDEQPYRISKYKNKWIVQGSLQKENLGGVFEIIINAETSQIESVIHGE
nr:NTF2 fold immunity protein [uncultured Treponema sp.]